jgi:DNA invertase Pin-like site-specific DNA recombinase
MPQKISEEKIKWIKELRESGNTYDNIRKITKSSKRTVKKICDPCVKNVNRKKMSKTKLQNTI